MRPRPFHPFLTAIIWAMLACLFLPAPAATQEAPSPKKADEGTTVLFEKVHTNAQKVYEVFCVYVNTAARAGRAAGTKPNAGVVIITPRNNHFGRLFYLWKTKQKFSPEDKSPRDIVVLRTSEEVVWLVTTNKDNKPAVYQGEYDVETGGISVSSLQLATKEALIGLSYLFFPADEPAILTFGPTFTVGDGLPIPAVPPAEPAKTDSKS